MKKALVVFKNGDNIDLIIESCLTLKKEYGFDINPVYSLNVNLFLSSSEDSLNLLEDFNDIQDDFLDETVKQLIESKLNAKLDVIVEFTSEKMKDFLKVNDLIICQQGTYLDDIFLDVLKSIYRPIIILRDKPLKFNNIYIASDDGVKVNNSVYKFLTLFTNADLEKVNVATWNYENEFHFLLTLIKNKGVEPLLKPFDSSSNKAEEFYNEINKSSIFIMGNLSHSFFLETVSKKMGKNLLEKINSPIFIA